MERQFRRRSRIPDCLRRLLRNVAATLVATASERIGTILTMKLRTNANGSFFWVLILISGASFAGCRHPQLAERTLHRRAAGINYTLGRIAESESVRPGNLAYDARWIQKDLQYSARHLNRNLRLLGDRLEYEAERFRKNQPLYRETLEEIFWGHPQNIEPNAIILFF
jgi:hypothetical protein